MRKSGRLRKGVKPVTGSAPDTEGRRKLQHLVDAQSQHAVAKQIGIGQQAVSVYLRRIARPGAEVRTRMHNVLGIPGDEWRTKEEKQFDADAAAQRDGTTG